MKTNKNDLCKISEPLSDLPTAGTSANSGIAFWWQVLQNKEKFKEKELSENISS